MQDALVLLRAACLLLPSYIHPDEYMQSVEMLARSDRLLGVRTAEPAYVPWEFDGDAGRPARSVAPLLAVFGPPLIGLRWISGGAGGVRGWHILAAVRLWLFVLGIGIEACLQHVCKTLGLTDKQKDRAAALHGSMWIVLVLFCRTLSNGVEALLMYPMHAVLVTLLVEYANPESWRPVKQVLLIVGGLLIGLGLFLRITFPVFAAPCVGAVLFAASRDAARLTTWKKKSDDTDPTVVRRALWVAQDTALAASACLVACAGCVLVDTWWWGHSLGEPVIAPWNNLVYNLDEANLAVHGLHPRYTHLVANLQILFGPFLAGAVVVAATQVLRILLAGPSRVLSGTDDVRATYSVVVLLSLVVPVVALSLVAHQEARFLLPLALPVTLLLVRPSIYVTAHSRIPQYLWLTFHALLVLVYGILHQGGVLPAALRVCATDVLAAHQGAPLPLFTYRTYLLPGFLLAPCAAQVRVLDFGSDAASLCDSLHGQRVALLLATARDVEELACVQTTQARPLLQWVPPVHVSFEAPPPLRLSDLPAECVRDQVLMKENFACM